MYATSIFSLKNLKTVLLLILFYLVFFQEIKAQANCNCPQSYEWLLKTFEENDAGFSLVVDVKGRDNYEKHNEIFRTKVANAKSLPECRQVLSDWTGFFRKGHIGIGLIGDGTGNNGNNNIQESGAKIREMFKNSPKILLLRNDIISLINSRSKKDVLEGIFTNGSYTVGILKDEQVTTGVVTNYKAFILGTSSDAWETGQIKAYITLDNTTEKLSSRYFMRDHSEQDGELVFDFKHPAILTLKGTLWKRQYPVMPIEKSYEIYELMLSSSVPFIEKLSEKTVYLCIPSFEISQKSKIDSVLTANHSLIISTPNFIVDIRNGTGGADDSYSKLMPYLRSGTTRSVGVELFSTPNTIIETEKYLSNKDFSDDEHNYIAKIVTLMRANLGKFVNPDSVTVSIDTPKIVYEFPRNVAILINHNNGSTDEQFLIEAKQSKKVKVLGLHTQGELDASNVREFDFPCGRLRLYYTSSRSFRVPDFPVDGIGIQPDIFLDKTVPESDWILFAKNYLEN